MTTLLKRATLFVMFGSACLMAQLTNAQTALNNAKFETSKSITNDDVKSLDANIGIGAGTLKINTGAGQLLNSHFSYSRENWKPQIDFSKESGKGKLTVKQPEEKNMNMSDGERNDWELTLSRNVPTNLKLRLGAGQGDINLNGARLTNLELEAGAGEFTINLANTSVPSLKVNAGVGKLTLNLAGNWQNNLEADVNGGIGDLSLKLPRKTGVRVKVSGLGSVNANGLRKEGRYYVNDAYGKTAQTLEVNVNGGLGSVELELE